jgi:hypothetical protein
MGRYVAVARLTADHPAARAVGASGGFDRNRDGARHLSLGAVRRVYGAITSAVTPAPAGASVMATPAGVGDDSAARKVLRAREFSPWPQRCPAHACV